MIDCSVVQNVTCNSAMLDSPLVSSHVSCKFTNVLFVMRKTC